MGYGPQDWDLLPGIYQPGADPRVWRHKACGERLEFPDDKHRCPTADRCGVCGSALDLDGTCPQTWDEAQ